MCGPACQVPCIQIGFGGRIAATFGRVGAGGGNRTLIASLEGWSSTIELHPRLDLHRRRHANRLHQQDPEFHRSWWRGLDSNQRRRTPADLQSAPFSHSGTPPHSRSSHPGRPLGPSDRAGLLPNRVACQRSRSKYVHPWARTLGSPGTCVYRSPHHETSTYQRAGRFGPPAIRSIIETAWQPGSLARPPWLSISRRRSRTGWRQSPIAGGRLWRRLGPGPQIRRRAGCTA